MILCHKCSGILASRGEDGTGLYGCGCMSGWVRGFEPDLSRRDAIAAQENATRQRVALFAEQRRTDAEIAPYRERLEKLGQLA